MKSEMTAGEAEEMSPEAAIKNLTAYMYYALDEMPKAVGESISLAISILRRVEAGELIEASKVRQFLESQLSDAYYCTRVWEAWGVGTMSEDDFEPVDVGDIMSALMDGKDDENGR